MSAEQFADTPAREIGHVDNTGSLELSVSAWGDYHDVYEWLVPLRHRKRKPHYYLETIRDYLADTRETQETFVKSDLNLTKDGNRVVDKCLQCWYVTEMRETSRATRFRNPRYKFYDTRTVPVESPRTNDDRHDHYQKWKDTPTVDIHFFAHHWGVSEKGALNWIRENYPNWKQQHHHNRVRLAKTIQTYRRWSDKGLVDLFGVLPIKYHTGKDLVRRFALNDDDWQPPERPVKKAWFCQREFADE